MKLSNWERRFILKRIRKERRFSFKQLSTTWSVITIILSPLLLLHFWIENFAYFELLMMVWLFSLGLCSLYRLCNIIKKYDDKFMWDVTNEP